MQRLNFSRALMLSVALAGLFLAGCATIESRISEHPEIFNSLSPRDQALVRQGRIREGMSRDAVWLAWGSPEQKGFGRYHGKSTETWIYRAYYNEYDPYYGGFGYPYYGGSRRRRFGRRTAWASALRWGLRSVLRSVLLSAVPTGELSLQNSDLRKRARRCLPGVHVREAATEDGGLLSAGQKRITF